MVLFDDKKEIKSMRTIAKNVYDPNEFIRIMDAKYPVIFSYFDEITSKKFGMNFDRTWDAYIQNNKKNKNINLKLIELIYYLVVSCHNKFHNFFHDREVKAFFNKTSFYVKESSFKIIKMKEDDIEFWGLVESDMGEMLEIIDKPKVNLQVHKIFNQDNIDEIRKELFDLVESFYKDLNAFKKKPPEKTSINFEMLNRKIQAFVRHSKDHNDVEIKEYYEKLSKADKIKELRRLTVEFLNLIYLVKENQSNY